MNIGDKVPVVMEVLKPLEDGEVVIMNGKPEVINNIRQNKFWLSLQGYPEGKIILCSDLVESEAALKRRQAIVTLIECG